MIAVKDFVEIMDRFRNLKVFEIPNMNLDLTISQLRIIGFVHKSGECRVQDIADGLEITAPSASVAVNKLAAMGWLIKTPDPDDGRASLITLAEKTIEVFGRIRKKQLASINRFMSCLSQDEQDTLIELLNRIVTSFENGEYEILGEK